MRPYVFAISDIHGRFDLMQALLCDFDAKLHQLVLIGDLLDRGLQSKEALLLGKQLVEKYQAVYLRGNHEEYFLQFLQRPEEWFSAYVANGGKETLNSLLHSGATEEYSPTELAVMIGSRYSELVAFLKERPFYYEWQHYLFVHAGVDLTKSNWKDTAPKDFIWIREPFHQGVNRTGKTIVFGHTITPMLHGDMTTTDLWQSDNKIGIDGGAVFGGSVHGVIFNDKGIVQDIEYQDRKGPCHPDF